jgi:hypothetical protein
MRAPSTTVPRSSATSAWWAPVPPAGRSSIGCATAACRSAPLEGGGFQPDLGARRLYAGTSTGHGYWPLHGCRFRLFGGTSNRGAAGAGRWTRWTSSRATGCPTAAGRSPPRTSRPTSTMRRRCCSSPTRASSWPHGSAGCRAARRRVGLRERDLPLQPAHELRRGPRRARAGRARRAHAARGQRHRPSGDAGQRPRRRRAGRDAQRALVLGAGARHRAATTSTSWAARSSRPVVTRTRPSPSSPSLCASPSTCAQRRRRRAATAPPAPRGTPRARGPRSSSRARGRGSARSARRRRTRRRPRPSRPAATRSA